VDRQGLRSLRINADDFGRSSRVNAAIIRAHRDGVLTSTSLMVTEPAADEAVKLAKENPSLAVGLHLCLADAPAAAKHDPALGFVRDGRLPSNPVTAGARLGLDLRLRSAIEAEVEAQLERFKATGLRLSHVDGHLNVHLVPAVVTTLCMLLPRFGTPEVRVPREGLGLALRLNASPLAYKLSHALIFSFLGAWARVRFARAGVPVADRCLGLLSTFDPPDERVLIGLLDGVAGRTELYLHPGAVDEARDTELAGLLSPRLAAAIRDRGIRLERPPLVPA
jgi:hopanoid biosynthesis associated protein HpnK